MLIRNLGLKGKHKLADRWSSCPYVVNGQLGDLPVYWLKPLDDGLVKGMHRNHILPMGQEVRLGPVADSTPAPCPRAVRRRKAKEKRRPVEPEGIRLHGALCLPCC